jgi:hypothetical protein
MACLRRPTRRPRPARRCPASPANTQGDRFGVTGTNGHGINQLDAAQFDIERSFEGSSCPGSRPACATRTTNIPRAARATRRSARIPAMSPRHVAGEPLSATSSAARRAAIPAACGSLDVNQVLGAITPVNTRRGHRGQPQRPARPVRHRPQSGVFLTPYGLVNNYWDPNYWNNNFTNQNNIFSVYGMAKFDGDVLGIRRPRQCRPALRAHQQQDRRAGLPQLPPARCRWSPAGQPQVAERTYKQNYGYLLPSFMLAADLSRQAAAARRLLQDLCPPAAARHGADHLGAAARGADAAGRPGLQRHDRRDEHQALYADSFDVSLEWYNRPAACSPSRSTRRT